MTSWWPFSNHQKEPLRPVDAAHHPSIQQKFLEFLDYVEPPNTFKLSDIAIELRDTDLQAMGYKHWREALPGILALAWEKKEIGDAVILYKNGKRIPDDILPEELEGPIRVRRDTTHNDDW
ncbi:hypothetical protein MBLNU230_g6408t1 [Neophaeotheca triangularis]